MELQSKDFGQILYNLYKTIDLNFSYGIMRVNTEQKGKNVYE